MRSYLLMVALSLSLIQTTAGEESPVSFQETPVRNSHQCRILCNRLENCQGSRYNLKTHTCSLFSTQILQGASFTQNFNTIEHFKNSEVKQIGPCPNEECGRRSVCVSTVTGRAAVCVRAPSCATPPDVATLEIPDVGASPMGTEVMYSCEVGYNRTSGEGVSVCTFNLQWSSPSLRCQIIDCGSPPEMSNTNKREISNTLYGASVLYRCRQGYVGVSGTGDSACLETGTWSPPTLLCEVIDCGTPPNITDMDRGPVTSTIYDSVVSYTCSLGLLAQSGSPKSICSGDGVWSTPTLVCQVIDCGTPPHITDMDRGPVTSTLYDAVVSYTCSLGLLAQSGSPNSICSEDGHWSAPSLVCQDIPGLITSKYLASTSTTLECQTHKERFSEDYVITLTCGEDELLTDCSLTTTEKVNGQNGVRIVHSEGRLRCQPRTDGKAGTMTVRCCKLADLKCLYMEAGPSEVADDKVSTVTCPGEFVTLGCNTYVEEGWLDEDSLTKYTCQGRLSGGSNTGTYTNGVCCAAPSLECVYSGVRNRVVVNGEVSASCPSGYELTGCSGGDYRALSTGSYIEGDECRVVTEGQVATRIFISCCRA